MCFEGIIHAHPLQKLIVACTNTLSANLTLRIRALTLHIIVIMAARRKPLSPPEIMRWAGTCGHENGTLEDPDADVRKWYLLFRLRMKKEFKINIEEVPCAT